MRLAYNCGHAFSYGAWVPLVSQVRDTGNLLPVGAGLTNRPDNQPGKADALPEPVCKQADAWLVVSSKPLTKRGAGK